MITVIVTPRREAKLYGMLVKKEVDLRKHSRGTLHAASGKRRNEAKWTHAKYNGWIRFSGSLGGSVVAVIRSKKPEAEGDLLFSFVGFLHRHFQGEIVNITIIYGTED